MKRRVGELLFALAVCAFLIPTSTPVGFTGAPKSALNVDVSVAELMELECFESYDGLVVNWPGPSPFPAPHSIQGIRVGDSFDDLLGRFGHYSMGRRYENGAWGWDNESFSCDPGELDSTNYLTDTLYFGDGEVVCFNTGPSVAVVFDSEQRAKKVSYHRLDQSDDSSYQSFRVFRRQVNLSEPYNSIVDDMKQSSRSELLQLLDVQAQAVATKLAVARPFTIVYSDGLRVDVTEPGGNYKFELRSDNDRLTRK